MRKPPRHTFRFKLDGASELITARATVKRAKKPVKLTLTAEDVKSSMALKGVGNTQTCSMAVCAKRQADAFPHKVEGFIDWQYSRAFVVSKINRETGLPSECFVYRHQNNIAKLNDSKGGQKKLLAELEAEGPRVIRLSEVKTHVRKSGRPSGKRDGSRAPRPTAMGAKLRFAVAQLGGV